MDKLPTSGADLTVGLEEEVFLIDRDTLDLAPCALEVLSRLEHDPRFKPELPASQLEILTPPSTTVPEAVRVLADGRRALLEQTGDDTCAIGSGVHPFAAIEGQLNGGERYARIEADYRSVARRQLVCALHVHVAVRGSDRALAVYNALRSHIPDVIALAANAPFQFGRDTGLATARPTIGSMLPRQGVPPAITSWPAFAEELSWGRAAGGVPDPKSWWWDLRPNLVHGTVEVRAADSQISTSDGAAVAAFVHCLAASLAYRHDAGEVLPTHLSWRIAENRWSACRDGMWGQMADLDTGYTEPTCERLQRLVDGLRPVAATAAARTPRRFVASLASSSASSHTRSVSTPTMSAASSTALRPLCRCATRRSVAAAVRALQASSTRSAARVTTSPISLPSTGA